MRDKVQRLPLRSRLPTKFDMAHAKSVIVLHDKFSSMLFIYM